MFISVFDSSGTNQWTKRLGGTDSDYGYGITADGSGNVLVVGEVTGTADLNSDGDTADSDEVPSAAYGLADILVGAFDSSGGHIWSERLGGTGSEGDPGIAADSHNNILVTGSAYGIADLNGDGDTADSEENNAYGLLDVIFLKLSAAGNDVNSCSEGTRCSDIIYNGGPLVGSTTYYWRIKYWDDNWDEGAWSAGTDSFKYIGRSVFYSVGTETGDIKKGFGAPSVTINDGLVVFDNDQGENFGVGDVILVNSNSYYVSSRQSSTQYIVTTASGTVPDDITSTSVTSIKRAFNSLTEAEANSSNSDFLGSADLTSSGANVVLNWAAYADGDFDEDFSIDGWTTDSTHYIRLFAPYLTSEVGWTQRHDGTLNSGAEIQRTTAGANYMMDISDDYVRVEGMSINGSSSTKTTGITITNAGETQLSELLVYDVEATNNDAAALVSIDAGDLKVKNSVIWGADATAAYTTVTNYTSRAYGISVSSSADNVFVYNCTVYNIVATQGKAADTAIGYGITRSAGTMTVINSYSGNVSGSDGGYDYNNIDYPSYNVASDTTASGTGSVDSQSSYATYFVSPDSDFHLNDNSNALWGTYGTDLSSDANFPVIFDIDGETRDTTTLDIGADERVGDPANACFPRSTTMIRRPTRPCIMRSRSTIQALPLALWCGIRGRPRWARSLRIAGCRTCPMPGRRWSRTAPHIIGVSAFGITVPAWPETGRLTSSFQCPLTPRPAPRRPRIVNCRPRR